MISHLRFSVTQTSEFIDLALVLGGEGQLACGAADISQLPREHMKNLVLHHSGIQGSGSGIRGFKFLQGTMQANEGKSGGVWGKYPVHRGVFRTCENSVATFV